jgi:hypothetical protein
VIGTVSARSRIMPIAVSGSTTCDVERLVGAPSPLLGRHAETGKLFLLEADADPELKPAARDNVDRRDILGEANGIVKWHQEHARRDADTLRSRRDRRGYREDRWEIPVVDAAGRSSLDLPGRSDAGQEAEARRPEAIPSNC